MSSIGLAYTYEGKPWWVWPFMLAAFTLSYWLANKELRCKLLPKKEDLESLRAKLIEVE